MTPMVLSFISLSLCLLHCINSSFSEFSNTPISPEFIPTKTDALSDFIVEYIEEKDLDIEVSWILPMFQSIQRESLTSSSFVKLGSILENIGTLLRDTSLKVPEITSRVSSLTSLESFKETLALMMTTTTTTSSSTRKKTKRDSSPQVQALELLSSFVAPKTNISEALLKTINFFQSEPSFVFNYLLSTLSQFGFLSREMTSLLQDNLAPLLQNPLFEKYLGNFSQFLTFIVRSESGVRLASCLPSLISKPSMESLFDVLQREAHWNWSNYFSSKSREASIRFWVSWLLEAFDSVSLFNSKSSLLVNGFLLSQGLPSFDFEKPFESLTQIINKSIRLFSTSRIDVTETMREAEVKYNELIMSYGPEFKKSREAFLYNFIEEEILRVMEPLMEAHVFMSLDKSRWSCMNFILCEYNQKTRNQASLMRGMSVAFAWLMSNQGDSLEFWKSFEAIKAGNCSPYFPKDKDVLCKPSGKNHEIHESLNESFLDNKEEL